MGFLRASLCLIGIGAAAYAGTITVVVNGNDNPFLAGQPNGTTCCAVVLQDIVPANSR